MGGCGMKPSSLLSAQQHIKFYLGNAISVHGPNITNKLLMENLRLPYSQILKSRIVLKPGKTDYLLNHLGLGDNATFLGIVANYDEHSVEEDDFIQYNYFSDKSKMYTFGEVLFLSGNSTNRIEQLYLTNPNLDEPVILDVLVAIIDDEDSFFNDGNVPSVDQTATFNNLIFDYITTRTPGQIVAILNSAGGIQAYINLNDVNGFNRQGKIVIIDDNSVGSIYLDFNDDYNAKQAMSILNWSIENPTLSIPSPPVSDDDEPIITFSYNVSTNNPYSSPPPTNIDTSTGTLPFYASNLFLPSPIVPIIKSDLITHLITDDLGTLGDEGVVNDNRDGDISLEDHNIIIEDASNNYYEEITIPGLYFIKFNLSDIAGNYVDEDINVRININ